MRKSIRQRRRLGLIEVRREWPLMALTRAQERSRRIRESGKVVAVETRRTP